MDAGAVLADFGLPVSFNATFEYCKCLIRSQMEGAVPRAGFCEFSAIFPLLIFALGSFVVLMAELLLPRKVTAFAVTGACCLYFIVSYIIIGALGWGPEPICQGIAYTKLTDNFLALVIANVLLYLLALTLMMLGAARKMPPSWIEYDIEKFEERRKVAREERRSQRLANASAGNQLATIGAIEL